MDTPTYLTLGTQLACNPTMQVLGRSSDHFSGLHPAPSEEGRGKREEGRGKRWLPVLASHSHAILTEEALW
jgi:hypothetical protein